MSKIDGVIAELESVLEKLGGVQSRLKEIKEESEAVEKARDSLHRFLLVISEPNLLCGAQPVCY